MKLRRFLLPDARWNAPRGPRTVVNLTRPGFDRVAAPTLVVLVALVVALVSGFRVGIGWLVVAVLAGAVAAVGIRQRSRPGEAALIADANHLVYASTPTRRLDTESLLRRQEDVEYDDGTPMLFDLSWLRVVAAAITPTGAGWWMLRRPRIHLDLYVTPRAIGAVPGIAPVLVELDPPAADLPRTRVRFTVPRFSQQNAVNMLRWYVPELLVDPAGGGSALFLEPADDPWPDRSAWAPPVPTSLPSLPSRRGRPDFLPADDDTPTTAADEIDETDGNSATGLRRRPGRVVVIGRLGRITGAALAWRVGWVVVRLVVASFAATVFTFVGIRGLVDPDFADSEVGVSITAFLLASALVVAAWRYVWRLLGLRGAATSFVAFTSDGVRLVDADSYTAVRWRVIRQATLHRQGRRSSLWLAVDAEAPADISWAVLRAPTPDQVLPGCTVLRLPLPPGSADAEKIDRALWQGGRVPFDSTSWPDASSPDREDA